MSKNLKVWEIPIKLYAELYEGTNTNYFPSLIWRNMQVLPIRRDHKTHFDFLGGFLQLGSPQA